jgi:hypothetical protein
MTYDQAIIKAESKATMKDDPYNAATHKVFAKWLREAQQAYHRQPVVCWEDAGSLIYEILQRNEGKRNE